MSDSFRIYTDLSDLPAGEHEAYREEGFSGICTGGSAVVKVFSTCRLLTRNDLVTILPQQSVAIYEISSDFSMTFFKINREMFLEIMSSLGRITPAFYFYMRKNFQNRLNRNQSARFLGFCRVLGFRGRNDDPVFRRETILQLLRVYYWDFYVHFQKITGGREESVPLNSHKESIAFRFDMLVYEHHRVCRKVAFYADKLCITPQYLTRVIQEVTARSARELIADYTVLEIKTLLRNANLEVKDVVRRTGFSNQSSMSRFFRQHTGMSPSEYRRTIHLIR